MTILPIMKRLGTDTIGHGTGGSGVVFTVLQFQGLQQLVSESV